MPEKQKIPLKKVVLVGMIFVPVVVAIITLFDVWLWKNEYSTQKLIMNLVLFCLAYIIFHKKMLKKE